MKKELSPEVEGRTKRKQRWQERGWGTGPGCASGSGQEPRGLPGPALRDAVEGMPVPASSSRPLGCPQPKLEDMGE